MNASINVPRILQGMKKQGCGVRDTCVNCGVNNKTLTKILNGEIPQRLDALYRLIDGLKIPIEEAVIHGGTPKTAQLRLVPDRRTGPKIA